MSPSKEPDEFRQVASSVKGFLPTVSHQLSTQSGVWKYEVPGTRAARSSHSLERSASWDGSVTRITFGSPNPRTASVTSLEVKPSSRSVRERAE